jgi:hypothetical protein
LGFGLPWQSPNKKIKQTSRLPGLGGFVQPLAAALTRTAPLRFLFNLI